MKNLNWNNAEKWEDCANKKIDEPWHHPNWSFDCNFKLDYDGPVVSFSSRFYPPHKNDHDGWEGTIAVFLLGKQIDAKDFVCDTLDDVEKCAMEFTKEYAQMLAEKLERLGDGKMIHND
jgi:hypothetical protein